MLLGTTLADRPMKRCSHCKQLKSVSHRNFNSSSSSADGWSSWCRECNKDYQRVYNRTELGKQAKARWVKNNIERHRKYSTTYVQITRSKSPRQFLVPLIGLARRRALRDDLRYDIDANCVAALYAKQGGRCALTGDEMTTQVGKGYVRTNCSLDRIDPKEGYVKSNVQLVCLYANTMKSGLDEAELETACRKMLQILLRKRRVSERGIREVA